MLRSPRRGTGLEALHILQGEGEHAPPEPPYVILLDLNMPRMGGLEFLRELRSGAMPQSIRNSIVFVLTTSAAEQDRLGAYEHHIAGYMVKPDYTGQGNEVAAVEAMRSGVRDYLVKEQTTPTRLRASIERAVAAAKTELELHAANKRLQEMALIDPVTQIGNRHHFEIRLEHALNRARRQSEDVGLVMMDLDSFKIVNDQHGHLIGDRVLREFGARLRLCARQSDTIARLAGDEFAVIMESGVSRHGEQLLAKRIEKRVTAPMSFDGIEVNIGVSLGVALFTEDGKTTEEFLRAADEAMYQNKRESKNSSIVVRAQGSTSLLAERIGGIGAEQPDFMREKG